MVAGIGSHWEQVHYLSAVISASGSADSASDLGAIQVRKRVGVNCLSTLLLALCRANFVLFYTSCWCSTWSRRWPSLKILAGEGGSFPFNCLHLPCNYHSRNRYRTTAANVGWTNYGHQAGCSFIASRDCGESGWGASDSGVNTRYSLPSQVRHLIGVRYCRRVFVPRCAAIGSLNCCLASVLLFSTGPP